MRVPVARGLACRPPSAALGVLTKRLLGFACVAVLLVYADQALGGRAWTPEAPSGTDAAMPGEPVLEPATLHSLGVRWPVTGDDNGDARVTVTYRKADGADWRRAYPLFWIHPDRQPAALRVTNGRLFAGSIVDLDPGTRYEIRLRLSDPDGGSTTARLIAETRAVPSLDRTGMRVRDVIPRDGAARAADRAGASPQAVVGLANALDAAQPGDLLRLQPGRYDARALRPARSGKPGKPIVIMGSEAGRAVLDGGGGEVALDLSARSDVWLETVHLTNARVLVRANGAERLVIRGNTFDLPAVRSATGIETLDGRSRHFVITDNRFSGPTETWPKPYRGKRIPELVNGVTIAGAGHDIAYNRIEGVGDGVNSGRIVEHNPAHRGLWASDVYNNDINLARTECIEADHTVTNVRVYRNRLTNCLYGVSAQPARGGPVYVFRNRILNTQAGPFKLHNHTSGVLVFHNTSVRAGVPFLIQPARETVNDVITRNNVFIGTRAPAIRSTGRMRRCDFDSDGFAYALTGAFLHWNRESYASPRRALDAGVAYADDGAVMLFARRTLAEGPWPSDGMLALVSPASNTMQLGGDSRAIDRGVDLANFNDTYTGSAPDLGCCELKAGLPHVGPRGE